MKSSPYLIISCFVAMSASLQAQGVATAATSFLREETVISSCSAFDSGLSVAVSDPNCVSRIGIPGASIPLGKVDASASNGVLSTTTNNYITGLNATDQTYHVNTSSSASWSDVLHIVAPDQVEVASVGVSVGFNGHYYVSGNHEYGSFNPGTGNTSQAVFDMMLTADGNSETVSGLDVTKHAREETPTFGNTDFQPLVSAYREFGLNGTTDISLGWSFTSLSNIAFAPTPQPYYSQGESTMPQVRFGAQGGLGELHFFDANHNEITNQVQYSFENGTQLYAGVTPEPASIALVGTALLGLFPVLRKTNKKE